MLSSFNMDNLHFIFLFPFHQRVIFLFLCLFRSQTISLGMGVGSGGVSAETVMDVHTKSCGFTKNTWINIDAVETTTGSNARRSRVERYREKVSRADSQSRIGK